MVLLQVCQYLGSLAEDTSKVMSGKSDRQQQSPAMLDGCPSLLQVDMARKSQVTARVEVRARSDLEQTGHQEPGIHLALLHNNDTDSKSVGGGRPAPIASMNGTVTSEEQAEFLQKPYLELYIYFDVLLILVAALIFFLVPQSLGATSDSEEAVDARADLPSYLPALSSLRYLSMVTVWMKHFWFPQLFNTAEFVLILSGFVLELAEQRHKDTEDAAGSQQSKYQRFLSRRIARLYPLYALHVIIGHLTKPGPSTCDPFRALLLYQSWGYGTGTFQSGKLVYYSCGIGTWFVSVIFGCYLLFPFMSRPMRHLPAGAASMLWVCCSIFIILPRALASPAGARNVWWDDVFHQQGSSVGLVELLVSQKSVLHGLPYFFLGMVLARSWVAARLLSTSGSDTKRGLVDRVSANGCTLGMIALGAQWFMFLKHPHIMRNGYGIRLLNEVWKISFQSVVVLGAAGAKDSTSCLADPVRGVLSLPWVSWLGELALPLYLTISWACEFSNKMMILMGISQKGPSSQATYFISQFAVTHIIALTIYRSCGALTARVSQASLKEAA